MLRFASPKKTSTVQPKLTIGQPNDRYEQQADRVADQVMRMPQTDVPIQRKCEDCEEEAIQMKGNGTAGFSMSRLENRLQQNRGSGQTLEQNTRQKMERGIGADFSNVNIHTGSEAVQMNRSLNARAFTHGRDIYFNQGEYQPQSSTGQHLLAHELTHVVQQNGDNDAVKNKKSNTIQRYVAYRSKDQLKHVSEEDSAIISPGKKYTERNQKKFDKQTERFDKKYAKQEAKDKISIKNKRRKEGWRHPQKDGLLVSDDGRMAVENNGTASVKAWADESLIDTSNTVLKDKNSFITLKKEPADLIVGKVPNTDVDNPYKSTFKRIKAVQAGVEGEVDMTQAKNTTAREYGPYNKKDQTEESLQTLKFRDCGKANQLIIGSLREEGSIGRYYKTNDGLIAVETANPTDTIQAFIQKIMQQEFPDDENMLDKSKAYNKYDSLNATEKERVNRKYGLDAFARPDLGQGVTTVATEYIGDPMSVSEYNSGKYNYHFAANIVQSDASGDYIALEGLADLDNWYFKMYGTNRGQSFHEKTTGIVQGPNTSAVVDQ